MRRRVAGTKKKQAPNATGRAPGPREHQKSPENQAAELHKQKLAVELCNVGLTRARIAEQLGVDERTVSRLINRGLEEYYEKRDDAVRNYIATARSKFARLIRTWMPKALGLDKTGAATGEPDAKAAKIVLDLLNAEGKVLGVAQRVEVTGLNGGPIQHHLDPSDAASLTDEQIARIRAARTEEELAEVLAGQGGGGGGGAPAPGRPVH